MKNLLLALTLVITSCSAYFEEEVKPMSEQQIKDAMNKIQSQSALKEGTFHMQPVSSSASVRVIEHIKLKKPNLPPYDVVYVQTDLEDILLELANSSGETVVIPQSVRGRKITLTHSGANFQEMLGLVLSKSGYSYNYTDGIWNITRYPVRNYVLEIGQSDRTGSLDTSEISSSSDSGDSDSDSSSSDSDSDSDSDLETKYEDQIWTEVNDVVAELIKYGDFKATREDVKVEKTENAETNVDNNFSIIDEENAQETTSQTTKLHASEVVLDDDNIEPWYKVTKSAGLITVRAAPEAHRQIEKYLEQTQESLHRQVFVEVRIVAVSEAKNTDRGIQWGIDGLANGGFTPTSTITQSSLSGGFLSVSNSNIGFNGLIENMASINDLQIIATPQILVRNNQIGYVKIVNELSYVTTETTTETTDSGTVTTRTDTAESKDAGTILSVFPYIGKNKVQMRLRLSVAQQSGSVKVVTAVAGGDPVTNEVPNVSSNIIDQDMILDFGRMYALGGYIENNRGIDESYVPGFNQIPGIAELMRRAKNKGNSTRFLIFIKVNRA